MNDHSTSSPLNHYVVISSLVLIGILTITSLAQASSSANSSANTSSKSSAASSSTGSNSSTAPSGNDPRAVIQLPSGDENYNAHTFPQNPNN